MCLPIVSARERGKDENDSKNCVQIRTHGTCCVVAVAIGSQTNGQEIYINKYTHVVFLVCKIGSGSAEGAGSVRLLGMHRSFQTTC